MTADFFDETGGCLAYSDAAWEVEKRKPEIAEAIQKDPNQEVLLRRAGSVLNISTHGYYEHKQHLKDLAKADAIIKANHGGEFQMAVFEDHSPIHECMAEDELNAKKMNVRPGGKQPIMKPGWYRNLQGEKVT